MAVIPSATAIRGRAKKVLNVRVIRSPWKFLVMSQPWTRRHHGHPWQRAFPFDGPPEDLLSGCDIQRLQIAAAEHYVRGIAAVRPLEDADRPAGGVGNLDPEF